MFNWLPLFLVLSLASAVPMNVWKPQNVFGIPSDVLTTQPEDQVQVERAPSTLVDHVSVGADDDHGLFRKFWELLLPKTEALANQPGWPEAEVLLEDYYSSANTQELQFPEIKYKYQFFPDIKLVKYQLPSLPEAKPLDIPKLPEVEWPEIKVVKYELPPLPEMKPLDLPKLPELELPEVKIIKYELPSLPELKLPPLPEFKPLELPDIQLVKYELPSFPEMKQLDSPPLPDIELPDIKIVKYELPLPPVPEMKPLDLPEIPLPAFKIVKLELPPLPELKPLDFKGFTSNIEVVNVEAPKLQKSEVSQSGTPEEPAMSLQEDLPEPELELPSTEISLVVSEQDSTSNGGEDVYERTVGNAAVLPASSDQQYASPPVMDAVESPFSSWPTSGIQLPLYPAYSFQPLPIHLHGYQTYAEQDELVQEPLFADFWSYVGGLGSENSEPKPVQRKSSKLWHWEKDKGSDLL